MGWVNERPSMWIQVVAQLIGPGHWDCHPQVRSVASSPRSLPWVAALPRLCCGVGPSLPSMVARAPIGGGDIFLLQCPMRDRDSHPRDSEGWGRLCMALVFQHAWFLCLPVALWTIDIITDPNCSRTTDPDMSLSSSMGLYITVAPVAAQAT